MRWTPYFKYRIYDFLMPATFRQSIQQGFQLLAPPPGGHVADFGCGTGQLIPKAIDWLQKGGRISEIDIDAEGLEIGRKRAKRLKVDSHIDFHLADLTTPQIQQLGPFDGAVAHFALYTVSLTQQKTALENMRATLKSGCKLVLTVPSENYSAARIVENSTPWEKGILRKLRLRYLTKPGLQIIERAMHDRQFTTFFQKTIRELAASAGFEVLEILPTYVGAGYHAVLRKS